jgi:hypothetical protein
MKRFFEGLARYFSGCGPAITAADVAAEYRRTFARRIAPGLAERGWPVPETDEGRSVCLDLMCNVFTKW